MVCMYSNPVVSVLVMSVASDVIRSPAGVTVDEDGFVYVCSFYCGNVVVLKICSKGKACYSALYNF